MPALLDEDDLDRDGSNKRLNASRQLHLRHLLFVLVPVFELEPALLLLAAKDFDLRRQQAFGSLLSISENKKN